MFIFVCFIQVQHPKPVRRVEPGSGLVIGPFVIFIIKPLTMIQAVCIPWLWFVGLQQWTEPNFGADEQTNGFPRWACALISSGRVILIQKNGQTSDQKSCNDQFKLFNVAR